MSVCLSVAEFIQRENLLQAGQRLVAGVSGGADSLCLLDCLHHLGYQIIVAHLDHQLRPESPKEADFVRQIAQTYDLPVIVGKEDVRSTADRGASLEEAARLVRYRFLIQVARDQGVKVIATGHTSDDQIETVLMHFLRGAGPSGLRGMMPATSMEDWGRFPNAGEITLVRPLLEISREQTHAHCSVKGLDSIVDPSNMDPTFYRNRIRHHLLPILETYNPGIRRILGRTARVMAGEVEWLAKLVEDNWAAVVQEVPGGALAIQVEPFLTYPVALQRALLREICSRQHPIIRDFGFDAVERARCFIAEQRRGIRQPMVGNLELLHFKDEVIVRELNMPIEFPQFPQLSSSRNRRLEVPGVAHLANGWRLEAAVEDIPAGMSPEYKRNRDGMVAAIDIGSSTKSLSLRPMRAGDRIQPLGMRGSTKVSDLFMNRHVPRPARALWPLVVMEDRVVWVVRLHMSDEVRLTEKTRQAIVMRLFAPKEEGP